MGLFDKVKEANKQRQEKKDELKKIRGQFLAAFAQLEYMGGYGDRPRKSTGSLWFFENQVELRVVVTMNPKLSFTIPTADISDVAIEGKDEVSRRVTVTRLLATGIFAFALKKKTEDKEAFITLVLKDGQEVVFHVDKKAPMDVKVSLSKVIAHVKQNAPKATSTTVAAPSSVADELTKLAKLKQAGVITQAEFDKKKAELLA
jgi:hypothetical protein